MTLGLVVVLGYYPIGNNFYLYNTDCGCTLGGTGLHSIIFAFLRFMHTPVPFVDSGLLWTL
jgi:hypothetical protein